MVPGLGANLLSVAACANKGDVTIFDPTKPRSNLGQLALQSQRLRNVELLYSFAMHLVGDSGDVALRVESADLWRRRMEHINRNSISVLREVQGNGIEYDGDMKLCDVCAVGKTAQQARPQEASHDVCRSFQLVTADLMGPTSPPPLGSWM